MPVDRVVVHTSGLALVDVGDAGDAEIDGRVVLVDKPSTTFFCWLALHRDTPGVGAVALVGEALSSILGELLPALPTVWLLLTSQLPSMLCITVARGAVVVAAPKMFGVTDADAMGGRPGLAAAPPIDTPQPAPARAGQARSP